MCSSETLAGCKEELRYPFVPSHSCYVGKGTLAMLGNGSEGSTGKCSEEPEGKAQLIWWRAPRTVAGRSAVCWTHFNMIPNAGVKGNKHEDHMHFTSHQVLLACVTHFLNFCKIYWCPWTPHTWTYTQRHTTCPLPHLICIAPLYAVQAHGVVCAFQSRQSHHKFQWYHDSSFPISFKLQNHFLFWKKTGKEIVLEVDWSGSAC